MQFFGYFEVKQFENDFIKVLRSARSTFKELFKDDKPLNIQGDMIFTGVEPEEKTLASLNILNFNNAHQVW